ncbi:MAG TPA: hypothetical protein QGF52_03585 [Nitrososphaerales archaeon]|nr:hypothetical protein [Nitrososphaerales archaeon]
MVLNIILASCKRNVEPQRGCSTIILIILMSFFLQVGIIYGILKRHKRYDLSN